MTTRRYETLAVTGSAGFVGRHLLRHIGESDDRPERIVALDVREGSDFGVGVEYVRCNLAARDEVAKAIADINPDGVIHMAAVSSGRDLRAYFDVNILGCQNLLSAFGKLPEVPRVLMMGSAAQYGVTTCEHEVVDESRPLLGATPYGISKTIQEQWALAYGRETGLPVVCVRPFNIIGPGQPMSLVPAAFLRQVADVVAGRSKEILVGNTATSRDFTDVRDIAAAIWSLMLADAGADGQVFNIASGEPVKIQDLLDACVAMAGTDVAVSTDQARMKKHDVPVIVGDAARLRELTGWQPRITWRQSLEDMWAEMNI